MPGSLAAGQLVDERYALDEPLAEDSLGTAWRAYDRGLQRTVVVRDVHFPGGLFQDEPARLQEALTAARLAIRLDHPGAVHVYDAFVDGDHLVVVTELVPGRTLATMVGRKGALSFKRVAAIALDLLAPLEALHALGLAHGALAPSGVVVPDKDRAWLSELGLAPTFRDAAAVNWAHAAGTPSCLAPEQLRHAGNSPAADMWALGATLYYAVEGSHAFPSVEATLSEPPRPPSRAGALWPVLERLLDKAPERRPAPGDIRADLAGVAGVALGVTEEPEAPRRGRRDRRRRAAGAEAGVPVGEAADESDGADGRDWAAVVASDATTSEPAWQDWSPGEAPGDASDIWLPVTDLDEPAAPAAPAPPSPWAPANADAVPVVEDHADTAPVEAEEGDRPAPSEPFTTAGGWVVPILPGSGEGEGEPRRYRATPSWPPADSRKGPVVIGLCFLVMVVLVALLVTNGRITGDDSGTTIPAAERPVLATDPASVPGDWITYRHASADVGISYPRSWAVTEEGSAVVLRDPATAAQLRIDYSRSPDDDPHRVLLADERDFAARHSQDYRRLQLSPANFLDRVAALWEYTYNEGPDALHAVELSFHSADTEVTLTFRAATAIWDSMLPLFHQFLSSIRPPV